MVCLYYNSVSPYELYSYLIVTVEAVHRYYESRRRLHNDSQPGRSSSAKKVKKNARKKEMRKRVLELTYSL